MKFANVDLNQFKIYGLYGHGIKEAPCGWLEWFVWLSDDNQVILVFNSFINWFQHNLEERITNTWAFYGRHGRWPTNTITLGGETIVILDCNLPLLKQTLTTQYPDFAWTWDNA